MTFAQTVKAAVMEKSLLAHPFYQAWNDGTLNRDIIADYAAQYTGHINAFPYGVAFGLGHAPNQLASDLMFENLEEELGKVAADHDPHPVLWQKFGEGMGARGMDNVELSPAAAKMRDTFLALSKESFPTALGALYAYEVQNPEVCTTKIDGLIKHYGVDAKDEATLGFFKVHHGADIEHTEACETLLNQLSDADKAKAMTAAKEHSEALWNFLSEVCEKHGIECGCSETAVH